VADLSDFRYNALYTNNASLKTFLDSKQIGGDWESTQTIAPSGVSAGSPTYTSIRVSWTPITYTGDSGGYRVSYSTTPGGPYTYFGTTADKSAFQLDVTGLNPGTTYYFVVQTRTDPHANNSNTVDSEDSAEVSASTLPLTIPTVTTAAASAITSTSASSGGNVTNDGGAAVTARGVCWSTSSNPTTSDSTTSDGSGTGSFASSITGLSHVTTYYVRAYATNSVGTAYGGNESFTTDAIPPTVNTTAASNEGTNTATLNGTVNANNSSTTVTFEYGLDTNYGTTVTADQSPVSGTSITAVSKNITGLTPDTTYHYQVVGQNAGGTDPGGDMTFTTPTIPTVTTTEATGVGADIATLNGTVNAKNSSTTVTFEYGLDDTYGTTVTADQSPVSGTSDTAVSKTITGLTPGTTYHYRVVGQNTWGTTNGADMTFTTLTTPTVTTTAVSDITPTTASSGGDVSNDGGAAVIARGVCWSTSSNPTTADSTTSDGSGTGAFTSSITGLNPGTMYYIRAYATNSVGTGYGEEVSFSTPDNPVISGTVTKSGAGVPGVTLTFSEGGGSTVTGSDGYYEHTVTYGWTGTVTPEKTGDSFSPVSNSYQNVTDDISGQDYTAFEDISPTYRISGNIATGTGEGIEGVILTFSNGGGYAVTNPEGNYEHTVDEGWTGKVTPAKDGYTFDPPSRPYPGVDSDLPNQDYTAQPVDLEISGRVHNAQDTGIPGVSLNYSVDGNNRSEETDFNGNYSLKVPHGWSGEVFPEKEGYTFDPESRPYTDLASGMPEQHYTATVDATFPVISGMVTNDEGFGIPDVTLSFAADGGEPSFTSTDANGNYSHAVAYGWSGTVTPSKEGYIFDPQDNPYSDVTADKPGEDYSAATLSSYLVISGKVKTPTGMGIPGVILEFTGTSGTARTYTNNNGEYIHTVPSGWTGTAVPRKKGFEFDPPERSFTIPINSDLPGQDFETTTQVLFISGTVLTTEGEGLNDVLLDFSNGGTAFTDQNGNYVHPVEYQWTGTVTPSKKGYRFDPPLRAYNEPLNVGKSGENYTASELPPKISGYVTIITSNGISGFPNVSLEFSPDAGTAETDENGYYEREVPKGWSGTVTPKKDGFSFFPASQRYNRVESDKTQQNYSSNSGLQNITLTLEAELKIISSLAMKKYYAELRLTRGGTGGSSVAEYVLFRKENSGSSNEIPPPIPDSELQVGQTYVQNNGYLDLGKSYTYYIEARNSNGITIAVSNPAPIHVKQ
jgi:hypothetical protein